MQELDDNALLREYAAHHSEEAFTALVTRHIDKVYSVALRHTGNPHQAEEITQAVFVILARKSGQLGKRVILEGWLYQTARLTAVTFIRSEIRRTRREQEAHMQTVSNENDSELWTQIAPLLDTAMAGLNEADRHAVVLRFFYGKSMKEVGAALGGSEGAARLRVHRAMEKLRHFFLNRGITSTTAIIAGAISANCAQVAPLALAKTAAAAALAEGAAVGGPTLALAKGVLKVMTWTNAKVAIVASAAIILAAGTTTTFVVQHQYQDQPPKTLPRSSWRNAGYGNPAATIQTLAWAVAQKDGKAMFASLSPDCQQEFRQLVAQTEPGVSAEQFLMQIWTQQLQGENWIRIAYSEAFSTDQVLLELSLKGQSKPGWLKMQKFGDEWKVEDFDPKGKNGRTGMPHPGAEYGGIGAALEFDAQSHAIRITKVLPNSPAAQAGLTPGLLLQRIGGTPTAGKTLAECVFLTRGRVGTKVWLQLVDPNLKRTNAIELARMKLTP